MFLEAKTYLIIIFYNQFYNEALHNCGYKNELEYLKANRHHINRANNIGSNGHKNRENNGTNNNINMDKKLTKLLIKIDIEILSGLTLLFANSLMSI